MPETVFERALVGFCAVCPSVHTETVKSAVLELAFVRVAVDKLFLTLTVFQPVDKNAII